MVAVTINGVARELTEGTTILRALQASGLNLPSLCDDPRLKPIAACRLCVVQVAGVARPVTACDTPLAPGMVIRTDTPELEELRRTNLQLLATRHRRAATECDSRGAGQSGAGPAGPASGAPMALDLVDDSHPYIRVDMSSCINCYRCVRICDEVQGQSVWRVWGRGDATRIVPDSGTTLRASSCVSCGACADTCPTGALEDKTLLAFGAPSAWTRTTCPYCGVGCEMLVGARGQRIVQIKPALDAPVNQGHLCVKGRYAFEFTRAPDRVTRPMIRAPGDAWRTVSWAEAIAYTADKLRAIVARHGADSVGVLGSARGTNEENYLAQKFARVVLGTNNVDCCARVCHAPTATAMKAMFGTGAATNSFDDIERAGGFLLCGANATENHPVVGARIKQAVRRGAKLIVIDPRRIDLARYADVHLALRPGTNVPLLNAFASVIVEERLFDPGAIAERVAEWDEFQTFIRDYAPENVAALCGVEAPLIRQAARLYATTRPMMCFHGLGVTEHTQGTEGVMCLANLALLTGNFGKPGGGVNPLRGQNNVQGSAHMGCEPGKLTGYVGLDEGRARFEAAWQTRLPAKPGLNLMEMIDAAGAGSLQALWAIGYDVALTNPNARATIESLQALPLVIVQDLFLNELARECGHVFLPACSSYEKDGTFMNAERRVQRVRAAIEPLGEAKPDWEIICELARALGRGEAFNFFTAEEIWEEIRTVWPAGRGITYARLDRGGLQWPCPAEDHPGTTVLHSESFTDGPRAPLKRVTFTATAETISPEFPFLLTTGRTLFQFNAGTMTMRTANAELRPTDTLDLNPADAQRLGLREGELARARSRHGEATLPVRLDPSVKPGEIFATFHTTRALLNRLTSPERDRFTQTPEYKVVAVGVEKAPA